MNVPETMEERTTTASCLQQVVTANMFASVCSVEYSHRRAMGEQDIDIRVIRDEVFGWR